MDMNSVLSNWLTELDELNLPTWDKLPDIDLYMEQLITYIDRINMVFSKNSFDKTITASMINNYVKAKIIPSPEAKKYSKDHIAYIIALSTLKQVLPITNIKELFENDGLSSEQKYKLYRSSFLEMTDKKSKEIIEIIQKNTKNNQIKQLNELALRLSVEAFIDVIISERILYIIQMQKFEQEEKERISKEKKAKKEAKKEASKEVKVEE